MPKVKLYNVAGEAAGEIELNDSVFGVDYNEAVIHQAVVRQMANERLGTHATKTRGLVRGGGKKPWKQKGTGRARGGAIRSPLRVGGGQEKFAGVYDIIDVESVWCVSFDARDVSSGQNGVLAKSAAVNDDSFAFCLESSQHFDYFFGLRCFEVYCVENDEFIGTEFFRQCRFYSQLTCFSRHVLEAVKKIEEVLA